MRYVIKMLLFLSVVGFVSWGCEDGAEETWPAWAYSDCMGKAEIVMELAQVLRGDAKDKIVFAGKIVKVKQPCKCEANDCSEFDSTYRDYPPRSYQFFDLFIDEIFAGDLVNDKETAMFGVCSELGAFACSWVAGELGIIWYPGTMTEEWFWQPAVMVGYSRMPEEQLCEKCKECESLVSSALALAKVYWPRPSHYRPIIPEEVRLVAQYLREHGVPSEKDFRCKKSALEYWMEATGENVYQTCKREVEALKPQPQYPGCRDE